VTKKPGVKDHLERQFLATWRMLSAERWEGHEYPLPQQQLQFHHTRNWAFDFAWLRPMVAVEIEGGIFVHQGSRHNTGAGLTDDCEKYNTAAFMGWVVIRLTSWEMRERAVPTLVEIARLIRHRLLADVGDFPVEHYALTPLRSSRRLDRPAPRRRREPPTTAAYDVPF
jgi:very-short-patch-repair endonuclease